MDCRLALLFTLGLAYTASALHSKCQMYRPLFVMRTSSYQKHYLVILPARLVHHLYPEQGFRYTPTECDKSSLFNIVI